MHFFHQKLVQVLDIVLYITATLVNLSNQLHFLLLDIYNLIDMLLVLFNEILFLIQNLVDENIVV